MSISKDLKERIRKNKRRGVKRTRLFTELVKRNILFGLSMECFFANRLEKMLRPKASKN